MNKRTRIGACLGLLLTFWLPLAARAASPSPVVGTEGMVVSESSEASRIGAEVLRAGGNAVDAAVAVHFALAVTYPQAGNLGGGGFMVLRTAEGAIEAIDFRETAPATATRDLFIGAGGNPDPVLSRTTHLAVGVPGSVAGMALAHERHGTRTWRELVEPAARLADPGFILDRYTANHLYIYQGRLGQNPEASRIFLRDGDFYQQGDSLRQPELGETLRRIARFGPTEFYTGETADSLIAEMIRGVGIMTSEDLRGYRAKVREPLVGSYHDLTVLTMPPPSSGGLALLQMLHCLEAFPVGRLGAGSSQACHLLAEVMKRAFADRAEFLGDADFTPVPVEGLLEKSYLDSLCASIDPNWATPNHQAGPGKPRGAREFYSATRGQTTHFSIVDAEGNAVAVTTTLNTNYGTGILVRGAGFLLNNEMDDFAAAPGSPNYYGLIQGEANAVRAFARPLSSMTPTIVLRGDELALILGSPGGPKIITSVLQTLVNVVDHEMDIQAAISAPRIHHQWVPDTLRIEPGGMTVDVYQALERRGHALGRSGAMGSVQGIQIVQTPKGRMLLGASDPRRNGHPVGIVRGRLVTR